MKRYFTLFLIVNIFWFQAQAQPLSGTYTIGGSSPDYTSFNAAVSDLVAQGVAGPVLFSVAGGTYNEQITIPSINGASAVNTITFQSASGDSTDVVLTYSASGDNDNFVVKLDGTAYIIFRGITLQATGTGYARIVHLATGASHISFYNNRLLGKPDLSELVFGNIANLGDPPSADITLVNNRFENGKRAVSLAGVYNNNITHSIIENNDFINSSEHAVHIEYSQYSLIRNNRIVTGWHITGIHLQGLTAGDTLSGNTIHLNSGGLGIHFYSNKQTTDTTLIANNFIYLNTTIADHAIDIYTTKNPVKVVYNTVHITGDNQYSYCLYVNGNGTPTNETVLNNIFSNEATGKAFFYFYLPHQSDYNDLYSNGQYLLGYYNSTGLTLDYWQNTFHHDLHSVAANPYFTSTLSYSVQNVALDGGALPVAGITTDIEGDIRDATHPDIGADEFTPAPAPLHGTYTVGGNTADFDSLKDAVRALEINGVSGAVVFNIRTGTYKEQLVIPEIYGASENNTITFRSAGGDSVDVKITFNPPYPEKPYTVLLNGAGHIRFDRVWIETTSSAGIALWMKNRSAFNTVTHCHLSAPAGIAATLVQLGSPEISPVYPYTDSNNILSFTTFYMGRYAVLAGVPDVSNAPVVTADTRIENNVIINGAINMSNGKNPVIRANKLTLTATQNYTTAIRVTTAEVANNFILMDNPGNYTITGIWAGAGSEILFNTVKTGLNGLAVYAAGNSDILNNVLVTKANTALKVSDTTGCRIDHNIYFTATPIRCIGYNPGGTWYFSLPDWQEYSSFDSHSLFHEPVFLSSTDLHTADPWLNNRGTPITGITSDIDGDIRDAGHPDLGADEFDGVSPLQGEYTIGATGDFKTFSEAADTLAYCGVEDSVIFRIQDGTYEEQFTLQGDGITRLPDTAAVIFRAIHPDSARVLLKYSSTGPTEYTVTLDHAGYVTLEGLTFTTDTLTCFINLTNGSSHISLRKNIFSGEKKVLVSVWSQVTGNNDDLHVSQNKFYGGNYALNLNGRGPASRERGLIVHGNLFVDQTTTPIYMTYFGEIKILANHILHPAPVTVTSWSGIFLNSGEQALIANNVISLAADRKSAGIALFATTNTQICYNSVLISGTTNESRCFNQESGSTGTLLKNNILDNHTGGPAIYTSGSSTLTADHNGYYTRGEYFAWREDHGLATLEDWQSETGNDGHSYATDPVFFSADSLYTRNPLLNGTAAPLAEVTTDLAGEARDDTHPDMGAYEFTGIYDLGPDTAICRNTSVTLDAGAGYDTYLWNTGATTRTIETAPLPGSSAWYKVTVTVGGISYSDSLKVSFTGPDTDLGPDTALCPGSSLILDAGSGNGDTYLWSDGHTSQTIPVNAAGTYSVTVTDANGCRGEDTIVVSMHTLPVITLTYDNNLLQADYQNGSQYIWYLDGSLLTLGSDYAITPENSGDYYTKVTDENGCTVFSDTLHVSVTGIGSVHNGEITIYPNPNNGTFTIGFNRISHVKEISLFNALGKQIWLEKPAEPVSRNEKVILGKLPAGIYILHIKTDMHLITRKIIIRH